MIISDYTVNIVIKHIESLGFYKIGSGGSVIEFCPLDDSLDIVITINISNQCIGVYLDEEPFRTIGLHSDFAKHIHKTFLDIKEGYELRIKCIDKFLMTSERLVE